MKLAHLYRSVLAEVKVKKDERIKIYDDEDLLVVHPLTHTASCKYGANTPWCIATPSNTGHFANYQEEWFIVYYIFKKTGQKYAQLINYDDESEVEYWDGDNKPINHFPFKLPFEAVRDVNAAYDKAKEDAKSRLSAIDDWLAQTVEYIKARNPTVTDNKGRVWQFLFHESFKAWRWRTGPDNDYRWVRLQLFDDGGDGPAWIMVKDRKGYVQHNKTEPASFEWDECIGTYSGPRGFEGFWDDYYEPMLLKLMDETN